MPSAATPADSAPKKIVKKKVVKKVVKKKKEPETTPTVESKVKTPAETKPKPTEETKEPIPKVEEKGNEAKEITASPVEESSVNAHNGEATGVIVEKPENAITTEGQEITVKTRVIGGDVIHPIKITWVKGKWNTLSKGDRFEMWENERTGEHFIKFKHPKQSDTGTYKLKASGQAGDDECSFEVFVGPLIVEEKKIEIKKGYIPNEKELEKDIDFRNRLRKVEKYKKEEESGEWDVWSLLKNASSREYEAIAFKFGIGDMRAMLRRLSNTKKRETQKAASFTKKLPETTSCSIGEKLVLETEVANEQMTVKWQKNGEGIDASKHYQIMTKENKRTLIIDSAVLTDDATYSCIVGKDITNCELFVREQPVTITKGLEDIQVVEGEDAEFACELSNENGKFRILKDGCLIEQGEKYNIKKEGSKITFQVNKISTEDEGFYQVVTNGAQSCAEIVVQEASKITQAFSDLKVNFKDNAEFVCEVSDEAVKGQWMKNGQPVKADDRIKIIEDKKIRKLTIGEVNDNDQGEYSFTAEGNASCAISAALELTGGHITVEKKKVPPKIYLDNSKKDRAIVVRAGAKIKLNIPISGEPAPVPEWKKGPKDGKQDTIPATGKRMWCNTSTEDKHTYLIINNIQIGDSDFYTCDLVWDNSAQTGGADFESVRRQEMQFSIRVVDVPAAPSTPVISNVTAETCRVEWSEPSGNGGCPIKGYVIERKKTQSQRWIRLNMEPLSLTDYEARRMIEGIEYQIRVRAVNDIGLSEPSEPSKPFTPLATIRLRSRLTKQGHSSSQVRAFRCVDMGQLWIVSPIQVAPCSVPTNFKISATTDDSIELSWLPPLEIGAAGLDGYKLEFQLKSAEEGTWKPTQEGLVDKKLTKLNLDKLQTGKKYAFRIAAVNKAGMSPYEEVGPAVCAYLVEEAKIVLPRSYLKPVKVKVGAKLHLNVPYQGKPKPVLSWTKDDKPLEEHVAVRNSHDSSVLFIRTAERWDSGRYQLDLIVGEDVVKAHIDVAVIGIWLDVTPLLNFKSYEANINLTVKARTCRDESDVLYDIPSKPRQVKLVEVIGNSASLKWEEPSDTGNTDILGYVVEKRDARSDEWFVVYDKLRHKQCQVSDLVLGNNYFFRVKALNEVGVGDSAATKDSANIPKEKTVYKKPEYAAMDFRLKPEFTQTLNNRRIVENYNGTLSCALKCNPRPKIRWFKNKIEIIDNPKYKLTQSMGIVQLEIRRARLNDAGTYTVTATNELGEASCSADVTIKEIKAQG